VSWNVTRDASLMLSKVVALLLDMATANLQVREMSPTEPRPTRVRQRFHGWVQRHIIAADPYDDVHPSPRLRKKRSPVEAILVLGLFALSALISITGLAMLWMWVAG
jgi:hypothetical protein